MILTYLVTIIDAIVVDWQQQLLQIIETILNYFLGPNLKRIITLFILRSNTSCYWTKMYFSFELSESSFLFFPENSSAPARANPEPMAVPQHRYKKNSNAFSKPFTRDPII